MIDCSSLAGVVVKDPWAEIKKRNNLVQPNMIIIICRQFNTCREWIWNWPQLRRRWVLSSMPSVCWLHFWPGRRILKFYLPLEWRL
jgi:hypothetical protein